MKYKLPVTPTYLPVQGERRKVAFRRKIIFTRKAAASWIVGSTAASTLLCVLVSLRTGIPLAKVVSIAWIAFLLLVLDLAIIGRLYWRAMRLQAKSMPDEKAKNVPKQKAEYGIDVTLDEEHIYHIRGLGNRTGGRALLDLGGVYALRYWLAGDTTLNLRFYDMYTQQDNPDWELNITGTGSVTLDLEDSRHEFIVKAGAEDRHIDPWELELEPLYDHALDSGEAAETVNENQTT